MRWYVWILKSRLMYSSIKRLFVKVNKFIWGFWWILIQKVFWRLCWYLNSLITVNGHVLIYFVQLQVQRLKLNYYKTIWQIATHWKVIEHLTIVRIHYVSTSLISLVILCLLIYHGQGRIQKVVTWLSTIRGSIIHFHFHYVCDYSFPLLLCKFP